MTDYGASLTTPIFPDTHVCKKHTLTSDYGLVSPLQNTFCANARIFEKNTFRTRTPSENVWKYYRSEDGHSDVFYEKKERKRIKEGEKSHMNDESKRRLWAVRAIGPALSWLHRGEITSLLWIGLLRPKVSSLHALNSVSENSNQL